MKDITILALAAHGVGISGGDRIFIEFAKRWSKENALLIITSLEGSKMYWRQSASRDNAVVKTLDMPKLNFLTEYLLKIFLGIKIGLTTVIPSQSNHIVYSASEFWMDSLPAFILKLRYPKTIWVAAWYQTAPNPLIGFGNGRYKLSALWYWLSQLPIKPLISRFADYVLINNENERVIFPKLDSQNKTIVVLGAVNLEEIMTYIENHKKSIKKYDAVFQGRFHPQKGVIELVDIWKDVVSKLPNANLAMIGDGPLMSSVIARVKELGLTDRITLFGYIFDGEKKYQIFSQSKLVVHPALYDSGGMASAEAMAFGLPCVAFDLPAYLSYYPQGMIKVKAGDLKAFANQTIYLLKHNKSRSELGKEASSMIKKKWSWNERAKEVYERITKKSHI